MTYQYGAFGHIGDDIAQNATQAGTVPVYVGVAPVNLIRGYATAGIINTPVKLSNINEAKKVVGYSSSWTDFSLCEAIDAHFNNLIGNVGPIYVINVLDPDTHKAAMPTTTDLTFANRMATIVSDKIILDTFAMSGKVEGVDYKLSYDYGTGTLVVYDIGATAMTTISVSYSDLDLTGITKDTVIGGVSGEGVYTGLSAIKFLYQNFNAVANIIAAPGWSTNPDVYTAMVSESQKINGHWDAFVMADIPLNDGTAVDTITKAKQWRIDNNYKSERSKVYWPMGSNGSKLYHLSTLAVVEMMRADISHKGIPMETPGNKPIPITKQYFGASATNQGFDQVDAKELVSNGISTAIYWESNWRLWGGHTAAYTYGGSFDARAIFDVSMRMLMHITNSFQREWGSTIDEPMNLSLKETILNREQEKLETLKAEGALIGNPKVYFLESENPDVNLMNGDFRWDISVTPAPPLKSATVYVTYTDEGFAVEFGGN